MSDRPSGSSPPNPQDQAGGAPERQQWPEEDFESTADEGGGFYPLRLGEPFENGRFVITRKLGWGGGSNVWLARDRGDDRHVALKVLSAWASREIEAGRINERDVLRKVANAAPLHPGFQHVVHLLHDFAFESSLGQHICFVTDVLSYSIPRFQSFLDDRRLPLKFILRITKHILKGLEYLHDECMAIHSDLKPANILLRTSDIDEVVMRDLAEEPAMLYGFPKTMPSKKLPIPPVMSAPLHYNEKDPVLHWVIADFGSAHPQQEHLRGIVQPYALRAPEVILGLAWGPAIDIWSLGCIVTAFPFAYLPDALLTTSFPKMYELATCRWLFKPEAKGDISRDVVHLAQMTQRTGQEHDDVALSQYEVREKRNDLKGMLRRATVEGAKLALIESVLNESTVHNNGAEEVAAFTRIMRSFLAFDPAQRPRAAEALLDPAFEDIL